MCHHYRAIINWGAFEVLKFPLSIYIVLSVTHITFICKRWCKSTLTRRYVYMNNDLVFFGCPNIFYSLKTAKLIRPKIVRVNTIQATYSCTVQLMCVMTSNISIRNWFWTPSIWYPLWKTRNKPSGNEIHSIVPWNFLFRNLYLLSIAQKKKTESNVYLDTWCLSSGTIEKKEDGISL